jgi:hypothetical protein
MGVCGIGILLDGGGGGGGVFSFELELSAGLDRNGSGTSVHVADRLAGHIECHNRNVTLPIPAKSFYAKRPAASGPRLKTPMPPPSNALRIPQTPISLKASGCDTYDSGSHLCASRNKLLAMETEGHYLGSMPPIQFINHFFPTAGLAPMEPETTTFATVAADTVKCEANMYNPFVSVYLLLTCTMVNKNITNRSRLLKSLPHP